MPTVLLLEPDAVFAAVLEDHLRVAGHQVLVTSAPEEALGSARTDAVDLVLLDGDDETTLGVLGTLRSAPESRMLPVLILAPSDQREARLEALRAGADDHLGRPLDLEELMLRIERLLGRRAPAPQLAGDLAGHPLPDLLQYVQQTGKTGRLLVTSGRGRGEALFRHGHMTAVSWGQLAAHEAALALLGLRKGSFRFESDATEDGFAPVPDSMPLQYLLLHSVWLADELDARRDYVPATGAILQTLAATPPTAPPDLDAIPIQRVFERIQKAASVRLFDLVADETEAPASTRLAVAWLVERGAVSAAARPEAQAPPPTTSEITSSMLFELNVAAFMSAAQRAGLRADPLPLLIVAVASCRPQILKMLQGVHGYLKNEALRTLAERLATANGASAAFASDYGTLSLHVQLLEGEDRSPLDSVVPVCGGVLIWLADGSIPAAAARIIKRLESSRTPAQGMVVASDPAARTAVGPMIEDRARWRVTEHEPRTLLGILRLIELTS